MTGTFNSLLVLRFLEKTLKPLKLKTKIWDKFQSMLCGRTVNSHSRLSLSVWQRTESYLRFSFGKVWKLSWLFDNCIFLCCDLSVLRFLFFFFHRIAPISNSLKEDCPKGFSWKGQLRLAPKTDVTFILMQMFLLVGSCVKEQDKPKQNRTKTKQNNNITIW